MQYLLTKEEYEAIEKRIKDGIEKGMADEKRKIEACLVEIIEELPVFCKNNRLMHFYDMRTSKGVPHQAVAEFLRGLLDKHNVSVL